MHSVSGLPVATGWFTVTWVTGRTAVLTEPHVDGLLQANVWYLRGRERDLLVDTGNGIAPLAPVVERLGYGRRREAVCLVTHAHIDHIGGLHEFDHRLLHPAAREAAAHMDAVVPLVAESWPRRLQDQLAADGYTLPPLLVDAVPDPDFDPTAFRIAPVAPTHTVVAGDVIDLGDRLLQVIELPGHTRGDIGLLDEEEGALLSGDAVYDGGLIDCLDESDVAAYRHTMSWLRELRVDVVYPGHGEPFGGERLRELADAYLRRTG